MTAALKVRQDAKVTGAKRYDGAPCKKCSLTERWVVNGGCVSCSRIRLRSPAQRARTKAWYSQNKDYHKLLRDRWREAKRPEVRKYNDDYRRAHLGAYCAHTIAYKLRKQKAMPCWADREAIQRIYENCPEGHQVDHAIPLRGKLVSGLHVESNLQYLPGVENNRKGNRYAAA